MCVPEKQKHTNWGQGITTEGGKRNNVYPLTPAHKRNLARNQLDSLEKVKNIKEDIHITLMSTHIKIKSADIKPGDIIKFEFGDYGNWVTAVIDSVSIDTNSNSNSKETYYPQKLIWHYLSDEPKETQREAQEHHNGAPEDCRAEKLGNNPESSEAPTPTPTPYRQFTCYSNLNDLVEKLN